MSIRIVAKELYRLEQEVQGFEDRLKTATPKDKDELENHLLRLRAERNHLRGILEAKKEPPPHRRPK
jgi:hypothetical protein